MARKDTINAMINRGISEENVTILLSKYSTMKSITDAGVSEIVALGISEEDAADIISKLSKRASRSPGPSKPKETAEEVEIAPMELVSNPHEYTEMEKKILGIVEEKQLVLPLKVVVEIAPMELVSNPHEYTEMENKILAIVEKNELILPFKVVVDIAARIEGKDLTDEEIEKVICKAADMCERRRMDTNESVGIMAAHSIGEPGTQMNMRTFHYAGVANVNVTSGLPRLIEIVDARRVPSTPSMTVPLVGIAAEDENVARHVSYEIETTTLLNVATLETDITNLRLIVRPDPRRMDDRGITMDDIYERLNKIKALRGLVQIEGFDIIITSDEPSYKKLQQIFDAAKTAKIKGIDGVSRAVLSKEGSTWKIITEGSNLKEVMKVQGVDATKVKTNSILEVADVLGIEAARNLLINEARDTLSAAGTVDIRHIMLVADLMTNDGYVKAIGRHGISGRKSSVLARAAFEITAPHLLHAAMNGEVDNLEGVAENIIVGQPVTLGTGAVNLIYTPKRG